MSRFGGSNMAAHSNPPAHVFPFLSRSASTQLMMQLNFNPASSICIGLAAFLIVTMRFCDF